MAVNDFELRLKDNFRSYRVFRDVRIGLETLAKEINIRAEMLPENDISGSFFFLDC